MSNVLIFLSLMVPGTMFLGLNDTLIRRVLRDGKVSDQLFVGFQYVTSGLLLSIPLFFIGIPEIKPGFWVAATTTAGLNFFAQWAWFSAFRREEASLISPLRLLTPPLVIFSGYLVLGEAPTAGGIVGILVTIVGLWLLVRGEARNEKVGNVMKRKGVLLGFLGAVLFAISFPFDKQVLLTSGALFGISTVFLMWGFASVFVALIRGERKFDVRGNVKFLIAMPFVHALGSFLAFSALGYAFAAYAASVKRLWSLWAVLFSGKFLKEERIGAKLLATLVMLLGIAVTLILG